MATPLTVEQIKAHPEYKTVYWPLKPTSEGRVLVGQGRGSPFHIAYQVHGHGPRKIVLIMGLGGLKESWQRQTRDLGHGEAATYSVLVLDNRGIGGSATPWARFSTSAMAHDVLDVLGHVGWTAPRQLNVVGISMGGMIAQELCLLAPARVNAVAFVSTAARIVNTVGFVQNLRNRASLLRPKSLDETIAFSRAAMFSPAYLAAPDDAEFEVAPFPTNGDRFAAGEVYKRTQDPPWVTMRGFLSQLVAAGWHHKSPEQLGELAERVGRERILVLHGSEDQMITVPHGRVLVEELSRGAGEGKGVKSRIWEGQGHVIPVEKRREFNQMLKELIEAGEQANKAAP